MLYPYGILPAGAEYWAQLLESKGSSLRSLCSSASSASRFLSFSIAKRVS